MKLFQKIIAVFFIVSYFLITSQSTVAYIYFKINQNYIVKNVCLQKDAELNLCLGSCYLKAIQERLNKNTGKQKKSTVPVKYNTNPIQEYITKSFGNFDKKEFVLFFINHSNFTLINKDYSPPSPPPRLQFFV